MYYCYNTNSTKTNKIRSLIKFNPKRLTSFASHKTILIGSDNWTRLGQIMSSLHDPILAQYTLITVSRIDDLVRSLNELNPVLAILSFEENQPIIDTFIADQDNVTLPIFCYTSDTEPVLWKSGIHVFTYSFRQALAENSILRRIMAVISLISERSRQHQSTFVPAPQQNHWVQDLSRFTLELDQKNKILERIKVEVEHISINANDQTRAKLHLLLNLIKQTKADQRYWSEFKQYFNEMNPDFLRILSRKHPCLTSKDLKYCCYLSMNLSNNEITRLLGINQESVRTHKYRLKKKMALSKDQNLEHYLINVNSSVA